MNSVIYGDPREREAFRRDILAIDAISEHERLFLQELQSCNVDVEDEVNIRNLYVMSIFFTRIFFLINYEGVSIGEIADRHNEKLSSNIRDARNKYRKDRLINSIIGGEIKPRLVKTWELQPGAIDQSNIGRLLVLEMSPETTRRILLWGSKKGIFVRSESWYGATVVKSTGVLERSLRAAVSQTAKSLSSIWKEP